MKENDKSREELIQYVRGLTETELRGRVDKNTWSILQVLEHLYLIECSIAKGIADQLENGEPTITKEKPIQLTTNRTYKVDAPSMFVPSNNVFSLSEIEAKLRQSRQALRDVVEHADPEILEERSMPHPGFGSLSLKQWIPFVGLHEQRHLEQIKEIKEKLAAMA